MASPLDNVCCARLPGESLPVLAALRCCADIRVARASDGFWLWWPEGRVEVLHCLVPVRGAEFFELRDETWFRPGCSLPAFEVPRETPTQPLDHILTPAPFQAEPPGNAFIEPVRFRLVRDAVPRATTALWCDVRFLAAWADSATSHQLSVLRAARSGARILVVGPRLPSISEATRFWGSRVLIPLGMRPEPDLPEASLHEALGIPASELAVVTKAGVVTVANEVLRPLSRASLRLILRESR